MMRNLLLILGLIVLAYSVSSPNPTLVYLCNATSERWGCEHWNPDDPTHCPDDPQPIMWWAKKPVRTDDYRLSVGSETTPVTKYTPGILLDIHIRALKYGFAYRGILLYAEHQNGSKVGTWDLSGEDYPPNYQLPFTASGSCEGALMHDGAREKPYYYIFKLRAPPVGTGRITIRCLLKVGYANTGAFYWPNSEGDVVLDEGNTVETYTQWVKGSVGQSCEAVCRNKQLSCNEDSLKEVSQSGSFEEIGYSYACKGPLMSTCSGSPASSSEGYCYYATDKATCLAENRTYTEPSCANKFDNPYNGARFCPCSGAERLSGVFSLVLLALFWVNIGSDGKKSRSSSTTLILLVLVTLTLVQYSSAHNWVRSRSRYFGASTKVPCHIGTDKPHVQVGPDQSFGVEWMTGHGSSTYFVLIKAEDEDKLELVSEKLLDTYIKNAPSNLGQSPQYRKYHRRQSNTTTVTVSVNNVDFKYSLKAEVPPTDPNYVDRPMYLRTQPQTWLYNYNDVDLSKDAYVAYNNPNYTWIIAVWRYEHSVPHPGEFDITNFEIPNAEPAGRYILQYSWRGYYDCIDIEKFDTPVEHIYGEHFPLNTTWQRIDHCYFPKPRDVRSNCAEVVNNVDYCMKRCFDEKESCNGIQVLPVHNPHTVYQDFKAEGLIAWDKGWCYDRWNGDISQEGKAEARFAEMPNTTYICYALLARTPTELINEYIVSDDPEDPVFYGTCYYKREYIKMIGYPLDVNEAPKPEGWRFGHKCLDCDNYEENKKKTKFNDVPIWKIADQCRNCDLEKGVVSEPPTPVLVRKDAICDGLTFNAWSQGNVTNHTSCNDIQAECAKRLYPLNQRSYLTKEECFDLARNDEQCTDVVILREQSNNTRAQELRAIGLDSNYTDCWCYFDRPCCKECSSKRSVGYEIYSLDKPTADPKCSTGVVAADGLGCCSASCGTGGCGTNTNSNVVVGHCCATVACGVTRSCDEYGPPCRMSSPYIPSNSTSTGNTTTTGN